MHTVDGPLCGVGGALGQPGHDLLIYVAVGRSVAIGFGSGIAGAVAGALICGTIAPEIRLPLAPSDDDAQERVCIRGQKSGFIQSRSTVFGTVQANNNRMVERWQSAAARRE